MGEFMKFLPITLVAVLSASLLMALLFVPTLGSLFGSTGAINADARRNLTAAETGDLDAVTGITGSYIQFLKKTLRHPWVNVGAVSLVLVGIYIAFFTFGRGVELFPDIEPEFANLDMYARSRPTFSIWTKLKASMPKRARRIAARPRISLAP
jgi:multidrug efflux pump